jgi:hypothetical protein
MQLQAIAAASRILVPRVAVVASTTRATSVPLSNVSVCNPFERSEIPHQVGSARVTAGIGSALGSPT